VRVLPEPPEVCLAHQSPLVYVPIPCPSGAHQTSIVTHRDFNWAALFCEPCEVAWTVPASHPAIREVPIEPFYKPGG